MVRAARSRNIRYVSRRFGNEHAATCDASCSALCRRARRSALSALGALLECLRVAVEQRAKKHGARFFHLLRVVRALDIQLEAQNEPLATPGDEEALTLAAVVHKHASAVPAVNWLFW